MYWNETKISKINQYLLFFFFKQHQLCVCHVPQVIRTCITCQESTCWRYYTLKLFYIWNFGTTRVHVHWYNRYSKAPNSKVVDGGMLSIWCIKWPKTLFHKHMCNGQVMHAHAQTSLINFTTPFLHATGFVIFVEKWSCLPSRVYKGHEHIQTQSF